MHLKDAEDIVFILDQLIGALSTPSEEVQSSIALTIVKLIKKVKEADVIERLVKACLDKALDSGK